MRYMRFVSKKGKKTKRKACTDLTMTFRSKHKGRRQKMFKTTSSNNVNYWLSTQSYNTVLSKYAQILYLAGDHVHSNRGDSFFPKELLRASLAGWRADGPMVSPAEG